MSLTEPRLRTGWRLVVHMMLVGALTLPASLIAFAAMLVVQPRFPDLGVLTLAIGALASASVFILGTYIARRIVDRRSFVSLGFAIDRHTLPDLLIGFLIPLPMLGLVFGLAWSLGWIHWQGWTWEGLAPEAVVSGLAGGLILFILVAISEETLTRGYQLQNLAEAVGTPAAWLLSSVIFAGLHALNPGFQLQAGLGLVLAGLFLAIGWIRTRRLWLPIGLHLGWNFFEGTVFGFPVSGLDIFRLMNIRILGPPWATGGAFGPEAGLIVVPALLLGTALVWIYTRGRQETA